MELASTVGKARQVWFPLLLLVSATGAFASSGACSKGHGYYIEACRGLSLLQATRHLTRNVSHDEVPPQKPGQLQKEPVLSTQKLASVRLAERQQTVATLTLAAAGLHDGNSNMIQDSADGDLTKEKEQTALQPNVYFGWHHGDNKAWHPLNSWRLYQSRASIHGRATLGSNSIYLVFGVPTVALGILIIAAVMVGRRDESHAEETLWHSKRLSTQMLTHAGGGFQSDQVSVEELAAPDKNLLTNLTPELIVRTPNPEQFQTVLVPSISSLKPTQTALIYDAEIKEYLLGGTKSG